MQSGWHNRQFQLRVLVYADMHVLVLCLHCCLPPHPTLNHTHAHTETVTYLSREEAGGKHQTRMVPKKTHARTQGGRQTVRVWCTHDERDFPQIKPPDTVLPSTAFFAEESIKGSLQNTHTSELQLHHTNHQTGGINQPSREPSTLCQPSPLRQTAAKKSGAKEPGSQMMKLFHPGSDGWGGGGGGAASNKQQAIHTGKRVADNQQNTPGSKP